jgi:hypothetical protein
MRHAQTDISQDASKGLGQLAPMSNVLLLMHDVLNILPSFIIALGHHELHSARPVTTVAPLGTLSSSFAKSRLINLPLGPPSVAESVIMMLFSDIPVKYLPIFKQ